MAGFQYSYEVCNCKKVTLGEIAHAIKEHNANSIESIGKLTDAGTACGYCKCKEDDFADPKKKLYLEQIVEKLKK